MFKSKSRKKMKTKILILLLFACFKGIAQKREITYYLPAKITNELNPILKKMISKGIGAFLMIQEISDFKIRELSIINFDIKNFEEKTCGCSKVQDSNRVTYIDGKKYYVTFITDWLYATEYKDFMSEKLNDWYVLYEKLLEEEAIEKYAVKYCKQLYETARIIKFDEKENIIFDSYNIKKQ